MRHLGKQHLLGLAMLAAVVTGTFAQTPAVPAADESTLVEQAFEHRFQMDYAVSAEALATFLPAGWVPNVSAQGPAKDCNVRVIFIDRINVVGPDNRPLGAGASRLVYLAVPVRESASEATGQMIVGGLTDNADDVPGPFGNYVLATTARMTRTVSAENGVVTAAEDWRFETASGEHIAMHVEYSPRPANRGGGTGQTRFFDPRDPTKYLLFRTQQATDIARNVTTTPPDRVTAYSFTAGGGRFATLFDGQERPLSWDAQRGYVREVSEPGRPR